jgi:hypothetical protein
MEPEFYAHSHPDFPNDLSKWHKLKDYLKSVAEFAVETRGAKFDLSRTQKATFYGNGDGYCPSFR